MRTYSGGMRRRLDLAAALVHRPPVLFLDEPTTGLDPASRQDLWDVIEELVADGTTVLLTTQYLEEADRLADRIVVIDHGRSSPRARPAELKGRAGRDHDRDPPVDARRAGAGRAGAPRRRRRPGSTARLVRLPVGDGPEPCADVLDAARRRRGGSSAGVDLREPTLDDVFLTLTGGSAE